MLWPYVIIRRPGNKVERIALPADPEAARRLGEKLWSNK